MFSQIARKAILTRGKGNNRNLASLSKLIDRKFGKYVVFGLIGVNTVIYGMWYYANENRKLMRFMEKNFTISSYKIFRKSEYHTLLTSFFSHKSLFHYVFNMFALYSFAPELVLVLGASKFLALYLGGGLVSNLCYIYWPYLIPKNFPSLYKLSPYDNGLGASGAVNAIVAFNILTYPTRIILVNLIIPLPAALAGIAFILYDTYGMYFGGTHIGHSAHLGGALFGTLFFISRRLRYF